MYEKKRNKQKLAKSLANAAKSADPGSTRPVLDQVNYAEPARKAETTVTEQEAQTKQPRKRLSKVLVSFYKEHKPVFWLCFVVPVLFLLGDAVRRGFSDTQSNSIADPLGAAASIIIGFIITLIVERRNEEKDALIRLDYEEKHRQWQQIQDDLVRKFATLNPIDSYEDVLREIGDIVDDCIVDEDGRDRIGTDLRSLYYLNPTAAFGHTLKYNFDAVLQTTPEQRASSVVPNSSGRSQVSPDDFRRKQEVINGYIEDNTAKIKNLITNSRVPVSFATLSLRNQKQTGANASSFEKEYLSEVVNDRKFLAAAFTIESDDRWSPQIVDLLSKKAISEGKQVYLFSSRDECHGDIRNHGLTAMAAIAKFIAKEQSDMEGHIKAHRDLKNRFLPLTHVPFQIVMSYNETTKQGSCIFFVANRFNLTKASNIPAFATSDRTFLEIFHRIFESVTDTYPAAE